MRLKVNRPMLEIFHSLSFEISQQDLQNEDAFAAKLCAVLASYLHRHTEDRDSASTYAKYKALHDGIVMRDGGGGYLRNDIDSGSPVALLYDAFHVYFARTNIGNSACKRDTTEGYLYNIGGYRFTSDAMVFDAKQRGLWVKKATKHMDFTYHSPRSDMDHLWEASMPKTTKTKDIEQEAVRHKTSFWKKRKPVSQWEPSNAYKVVYPTNSTPAEAAHFSSKNAAKSQLLAKTIGSNREHLSNRATDQDFFNALCRKAEQDFRKSVILQKEKETRFRKKVDIITVNLPIMEDKQRIKEGKASFESVMMDYRNKLRASMSYSHQEARSVLFNLAYGEKILS